MKVAVWPSPATPTIRWRRLNGMETNRDKSPSACHGGSRYCIYMYWTAQPSGALAQSFITNKAACVRNTILNTWVELLSDKHNTSGGPLEEHSHVTTDASSLTLSALFFLSLHFFIFFIRTQNQHPEVSEKLFKNISFQLYWFKNILHYTLQDFFAREIYLTFLN